MRKGMPLVFDGDLTGALGPYAFSSDQDYFVVHLTDKLLTYDEMQSAIITMHDPRDGTDFIYSGEIKGPTAFYRSELAWYFSYERFIVARGVITSVDEMFKPGIDLGVGVVKGGNAPNLPYVKSIDLASEPEQPETVLTNRDLYKIINGKPTKLTLYKKLGGKLIPLDEHTKEVKT